jgi:hypothetical protein
VGSSERAEFQAALDVSQPQKELDNLRAKQESLLGAGGLLDRHLSAIDSSYKRGIGTIAQYAKAHVDAASSMGQVLEAGTSIAQGFAQGGPIGGAIAGATTLVDQLTKSWERELTAENDAIAAHFRMTDALAKTQHSLDDQISVLKKQLAGPETAAQAWERNQKLIDDAQNRRWGAIGENNQTQIRFYDGEIKKLTEIQQLENARFINAQKAAAIPPVSRVSGAGDGIGAGLHNEISDLLKGYDEAQKAQHQLLEDNARSMNDMVLAVLDGNEEIYESDQKLEADRLALKQQGYAQMFAEDEAYARQQLALQQQQASEIAGAMAQVAAASGELLVAGMSGSQDAFQNFLKAASQAAGGFITLQGGKLLADGVANALITGGADPLAYAEIAGGIGLIAGGAAISSGGPAAVNSLLGIKGGGGSHAALRDPGVNTGRGSRGGGGVGGSGDGQTIVNITYGAITGNPADFGKEVANAIDANERRGGRTRSDAPQGPKR